MTTNYRNAFITASPDSKATRGEPPPKAGSVAAIQYELLRGHPYAFTSDDVLFEVHARRAKIADADRARERGAFLAKPLACLRASPLVKQYGWGLHHDENGRVAAYGVESPEYRDLASKPGLKILAGMRNARAGRNGSGSR